MGLRPRILAISLAAACLSACDLPKDPEHTTDQVRGQVLRVGVSENPPWIRFDGAEPRGVEADLVRGIAAQMGARIAWRKGSEGVLLEDLKGFRLDMVAGGMTADSPWAKSLGAPKPYAKLGDRKHLIFLPPGENRWLLTVDDYQQAHKDELQSAAVRAR